MFSNTQNIYNKYAITNILIIQKMHQPNPPNPSQSPSPQPPKLKKPIQTNVLIKKATQNDDLPLPILLPDPTNPQKNIKFTGPVKEANYVQNVEIGKKGQRIEGKQCESGNLVKLSMEKKSEKIDNLSVGQPQYRIQKNGIQYNHQENVKKIVDTSFNNLQSAPKLSRLKFQKSARRNSIINTLKSHSPQPFEPPKKHSKIIPDPEKITQRQASLIQIQAEIQIATRAKALLGLSCYNQNLQQNFSVKQEEDQPKLNVVSQQKQNQEKKEKEKQKQKEIEKEQVKQKNKQNQKDNNKESNELNFSFSKEIGYGKEQISAQLQVYKDFNQNFQSNSLGRYEEQIDDELRRQSSGEQAYGRKFKIKSQIREEIERRQKERAQENERKFYKKRDFRKNINKKRLRKQDKRFMMARRPVVLDEQIYDSDQEQLRKKINKQKQQQNKLNEKQPNAQQNQELKISSFEHRNPAQLTQLVSYQIPELPNPKISLLQPQIHQQEFSQLILPEPQPALQSQFQPQQLELENKKYPSLSVQPHSQQEVLYKLAKIFKELDGIANRVSMIQIVVANQMLENRKQRQRRRESAERKDRKDDNRPKKIRRKASEINRKFVCRVGRCRKSYGTSSSLKNHVNRKHVIEESREVQKVGKSYWLKGQYRQPKQKQSRSVQKMPLNKIQQQQISEESNERIDQILKREQSQRIQEQKIEEEIYYSDQDDQMYDNQDESGGCSNQSGSSSYESKFKEQQQEQGEEKKAKREAMKD